jgi:membrane-bound ClpP family serine protease
MAFDRTNFILLGIGMVVILIGFALMCGPGSTEGYFEPDIFSARRIKVAPLVSFFGFVFMIYGIVRKPKDAPQLEEPKEGDAQ